MPPKLGKQITRARVAKALSIRKLARKIGKSPAYLVMLEQAEVSPGASEETLKNLARELELDIDVLLATSQRAPEGIVPRSPTDIALYRLIHELSAEEKKELRSRLEEKSSSRRKK